MRVIKKREEMKGDEKAHRNRFRAILNMKAITFPQWIWIKYFLYINEISYTSKVDASRILDQGPSSILKYGS